jgi:predicted metal-dependent hydrolase
MLRGEIGYGQRRIAYTAKFSKRTTMAISVLPDRSVELVAPVGTGQHELEQRLRKRARWVCRQIDHFTQFIPRTPPRRYIGGETHLYLGRQYRLKIVAFPTESVKLSGGYFVVALVDRRDSTRVRELLQSWYQEKAELRLRERFETVLPTFERLGCKRPRLRIQPMVRRWGSHSSSGTITLNPELVKAPTPCIDYVIAHELVHLLEPYHSPRFFAVLDKALPLWRSLKMRLELSIR